CRSLHHLRTRIAPLLRGERNTLYGLVCWRRTATDAHGMAEGRGRPRRLTSGVLRLQWHSKMAYCHRPPDKSVGLQLPRQGCRVWRYDSRPAANVDRRVHTRMGGEPTERIATQELRLQLAIGLLAVPTAATGLAGVGRVNVDQRHACQRGLVGDERPQLKEGPTVQHSSLALPNRF